LGAPAWRASRADADVTAPGLLLRNVRGELVITEDQAPVIDFLASPSTHGGHAVERIDTHTALVFLAGTRAWKLKRAVRFDYLDFSTADRRRTMCEAEMRLNLRTAPALYRRVVAVTRAPDGSLALGGTGVPVDWVLEMNRFEQEGLLDRRAEQGRLDLALMAPLGAIVARFHQAAERRADHGGSPGMRWVIDGNAARLAEFGTDIFASSTRARVIRDAQAALERCRVRLDTRRAAGLVRQCHGDLHLRNIVLLDGSPTLFDAVEFNDEIACIDVAYDLAFLLMDLWRRGLPQHANAVWNGYLAEVTDFESVSLLPLFLSCRAAVRAKTSATAAHFQQDPCRARELRALAQDYLTLAESLLHPPDPHIIAIGGFSGSGKSTLALALAPAVGAVPGAVVLRSDEIRKRLCGVPRLQRLGPEGYTREISREVYSTAARLAATLVRGGHGVVVDAVFANPQDRMAIERAAARASVPFVGLWLDAPAAVLLERAKHRTADVSDATPDVIHLQLAQETGAMTWDRLDGSATPDAVLQAALRRVRNRSRLVGSW
jgi:aminoglycoside phosphotransferase family enzyme/predicted kinase